MTEIIDRPSLMRSRLPWVLSAAVVLVLVALPLTWNNLYYQNMIILGMTLAIMAATWNVMGGFAGYVSLGHSAFLGVGAYTTAVLATDFGWPMWAGLIAAILSSMVVAVVVGLVARRTRGVAFIMVTFALLELLKILAMNFTDLTHGNHGISLPIIPLSRQAQQWPYYYGLLAVLVVTMLGVVWIRRAKLGAGLLTIREDESKAAGIGIVTPRYKMVAFIMSAAPVGIAGGLYAYYLGFIEPAGMFSVFVSMQVILVALLGGRGTIFGPILGAAIVEPLSQVTNQAIGGPDAGSWRLVLFGGLIVLVVLLLPKGIIPTVSGWVRRSRARGTVAATGVRVTDAVVLSERTGTPPPAIDDDILTVTGLTKSFGGVRALDGCDFAVPRGSITALIGPNGSGKTTAFNVIDGSVSGAGGTVVLDGVDITRMPRWERAHRGLGRTYQTTRLFTGLTVRENLVAPLRSNDWSTMLQPAFSGEERDRAFAALEAVGLAPYFDARAGSLSYGQQKLVELAQAIVLEPALILLDEPGAGINPALIERMTDIVLTLRAGGTTFLVVEHNMPLVLSLCNPIHVLTRGVRIASGSPDEIRGNELVLEAYLGAHLDAEGVKR
ncbi:branched-chain amino acid ABC transporter ATP-binding protein/permease [Agromyces bauzanensis]